MELYFFECIYEFYFSISHSALTVCYNVDLG